MNRFTHTGNMKKSREQVSKERSAKKMFYSLLNGTILTRNDFIRYLPFLFYVTFLSLIYISNTYYAEKTLWKINKVKKEIKEYRYELISAKSELMHLSKQSEVARRLAKYHVKESFRPPYKLYKENIESDNTH